jgi:hypothetical protein
MNDFFNWSGFLFVGQQNWFWILLSALMGAYVAWHTCDRSADRNN